MATNAVLLSTLKPRSEKSFGTIHDYISSEGVKERLLTHKPSKEQEMEERKQIICSIVEQFQYGSYIDAITRLKVANGIVKDSLISPIKIKGTVLGYRFDERTASFIMGIHTGDNIQEISIDPFIYNTTDLKQEDGYLRLYRGETILLSLKI